MIIKPPLFTMLIRGQAVFSQIGENIVSGLGVRGIGEARVRRAPSSVGGEYRGWGRRFCKRGEREAWGEGDVGGS